MKKNLLVFVISICLMFTAFTAFAEADAPCITLYANGGTLVMDGDAEETTHITASMEPGQTFGEVLELDRILSVNKENEEFVGWTVYDVTEMETSETYAMDDEAICIELPEGNYMVLRDYTFRGELVSTEELAEYVCGESDIAVIANYLTEEEYYADIRAPYDALSSITMFANGGAMTMVVGQEEFSTDIFTYMTVPGTTFGEAMELDAFLSVDKEGGSFSGWTVYAEDPDASVDAGGVLCFEMEENQPAAARTYAEYYWMISTEELAEIVCENMDYIVVANWMSEDEDYMGYDEYEEVETVVMPSITLLTDEGFSVASVEPGQTFGEVLELDAIDVGSAEGGEFIGWTVYEYNIEAAEYSETCVEEEGVLCFELFEDYHWVLREYEVCEELISTEELAGLICGAPDHLVVANFQ